MKARKNKQDDDAIPGWQTIYCSLILIMLVLFVMLASYASADKEKMTGVKSNLRGARSDYRKTESQDGAAKSLRSIRASESAWISEAMQSLNKTGAASRLRAEDVSMEKTLRGFTCKIKSDALFLPGDAALSEKIYPYLDEMIRLAEEKRLSLKIGGHTDDTPVLNNAFSSNWELSTLRATNVLRYFAEKGKIPMERLAAAGFSQYRPLVSNDTPRGREQNRRIEVVFEIGNN